VLFIGAVPYCIAILLTSRLKKGCEADPKGAVRYLQKAAQSAVYDLHSSVMANPTIARDELVLAIYELGQCFRQGWGVPKNKVTAAYYLEIAANLGDPDAQNDLGFCYANAVGVKKVKQYDLVLMPSMHEFAFYDSLKLTPSPLLRPFLFTYTGYEEGGEILPYGRCAGSGYNGKFLDMERKIRRQRQ
jgi:hypothetical protein